MMQVLLTLGKEVEKIVAEKDELQIQFDTYKRTMMAEYEKLQMDLVNESKPACMDTLL